MIQFEVLMDKDENPRKCTVEPLRGHPALTIRKYGRTPSIAAFQADVLLHIDGEEFPILVTKRPIQSIGLIDCIWKKVEPTLKKVEGPLPVFARIPEGFVTAYPRRNKKGLDPAAGLATIEAMFISAAFCGDWNESLLEKYHFKNQFLSLNLECWKRYQLGTYAV